MLNTYTKYKILNFLLPTYWLGKNLGAQFRLWYWINNRKWHWGLEQFQKDHDDIRGFITADDLCKMHNSYFGEEGATSSAIDSLDQLRHIAFNGRELRDFVNHCMTEYKIKQLR